MPIECTLLNNAPVPLKTCPKCHEPFVPFLRGSVQRRKRRWWLFGEWDYCALICDRCQQIVGYESPNRNMIQPIMIKCPVHSVWIHTGMAMDAASFERATLRNNSVQCPECGNYHTWDKKDAELRQPETPAAN